MSGDVPGDTRRRHVSGPRHEQRHAGDNVAEQAAGDRLLPVGHGSGESHAVLARLVYTIAMGRYGQKSQAHQVSG